MRTSASTLLVFAPRDDRSLPIESHNLLGRGAGHTILVDCDRLSKDSKTYLAKRAKHTEAQYEALLAAGRTQWRAGERVRFYRSQGLR